MEEFLDAVPGGRLTLAALALLALPGVRKQLRPVAKAAIRAGITVTDQVKEMVAEAREQTSDLVAEVRAEREKQPDLGEPEADSLARGRRSTRETPAPA